MTQRWESMTKRTALLALTIAAVGSGSCIHPENPLYCQGHPDDPTCRVLDAGTTPDTTDGCTSSAQCAPPKGVCELTTKTCVQCIAPDQTSACSGTSPVCQSDNTCHGCASHTECSSDVCLPDGSCSDGSNVAYVDPAGTDNASCTKATPCTKVAKALATSRPYVKFTGTTNEPVSINNQNVGFLADPGAKLTEATAGIVLEVRGNSQVTVEDLRISDGLANGIGVSMPAANTANVTLKRVTLSGNGGGGITASGGTLTVTQSTISGNAGGGISISGAQFSITNNFIVANGSATTAFGGVDLQSLTTSGTYRLEFNTLSGNTGAMNANTGIACPSVFIPVATKNNIVYSNTVSGVGAQIGGSNCACTYCDIGPVGFTGTGNINADPMFVNPGQANYHLMASSPCKDAADPAATLDVDFDGDSRPQGSGRDIGADEVH